MVFHWSLSVSKSPQVSRTVLSILTDLNNAVVWIVSVRPPISKSSRPFNNPLVIVPNAPITIGTIVTFMFHSFFNSLARSKFLSFFSLSFRFILWSAGTAKSTILQIFFLLLINMRSGLLAWIRWTVRTLKSHRSLCVSFSWTGAGLCIYHLFVWLRIEISCTFLSGPPCRPSHYYYYYYYYYYYLSVLHTIIYIYIYILMQTQKISYHLSLSLTVSLLLSLFLSFFLSLSIYIYIYIYI